MNRKREGVNFEAESSHDNTGDSWNSGHARQIKGRGFVEKSDSGNYMLQTNMNLSF